MRRPESGSLPRKLVQITDCHLSADPSTVLRGGHPDARLNAVVEHLVRVDPPDLVVVTGDISNDGSLASYRRFHRYLRRLRCPVHCLPGNHDRPDRLRRSLSRRPCHVVKTVRYRGWLLCFLDTTVPGRCGGHLRQAEWARIEARLRRHPGIPTLLFLHHPPLPCGSRWMDEAMLLDNPERLFDGLRDHPQVRALIWGHIHQPFESSSRNGIQCWAAPATAMQFRSQSPDFATDDAPPAYRRIRLHADGRLESEVVAVSV